MRSSGAAMVLEKAPDRAPARASVAAAFVSLLCASEVGIWMETVDVGC